MPPLPPWIEPQLVSPSPRVPDGAGWIHELKYDGYRLHLRLESGRVRLLTRRGHDWAERMPTLTRKAESLPADAAYLDGELVVLDEDGHPDFDALHAWIRSSRRRVPGLLAYQAFDLLHRDGEDLRVVPLVERKAELAALLAGVRGPRIIRYVDHLEGSGTLFFDRVRAAGLEGVVSKRAASRYRPGMRAADWVKTKCFERYDLVAVGFTGALSSVLLAREDDDGVLHYVGRVKGWVTRKSEAGLVAALSERETDAWPLAGRPPSVKGARWVRPELTVTVTALPRDEHEPLRHATLRGWRPRNVLRLLR
ncbi:MAG TPA: non-homologous end-joining DNA ligase [Longimicrobium sp.]|nr:non-homologous end-joining DNA ligase [Longimicrobium sp.]